MILLNIYSTNKNMKAYLFTFLFISFIYWALYSFYLWFYIYFTFCSFLWYYDFKRTLLTICSSNSSSTFEYYSCKCSSFSFSSFALFRLMLLVEGLKNEVFDSLIIDILKGLITQLADILTEDDGLLWFFYVLGMSLSFNRDIGSDISSLLDYSE